MHSTVNASRLHEGVIRVRIDGLWQDVETTSLPDQFVRWSLTERISRLKTLATKGFDPRDLDGPHNACVATYGGWRRDSVFSLNTAYKGMGFVPKSNRIEDTLKEIQDASDRANSADIRHPMGDMLKKTQFLADLYKDSSRFDLSKQVSLELFTQPDYATHTFLNMMANPVASASFLAYPTFEIRTVPHLLHPNNKALTNYERNIVQYTNAIHNFVHGGHQEFMTCVYHIIEVFDDTPNDSGAGTKIA